MIENNNKVVEDNVKEEIEEQVDMKEEEQSAEEHGETDDLEQEIEQLKTEKDELQQKLLRVQADFENFRKRTKKERENDLKYKSQDIALELLPVVDNFERALQVEMEEEAARKLVEGMEMIYRQLLQALQNAGIEEIKAEGEPFDPHYHQAVMQVKEEDKESNIVLEVLQKGYLLKDRVIRPAMVKVNE